MRIFATVAATMFCIFALMTGVNLSAASKPDSPGSRTAVLLEDFATLRTNDDGSKLWGAYRGENPNQEAKLDTGAFRIEVGEQEVAGRGSGAYLHFSPYGQQGYKTSTELSKDASGNPVPTAFAKSRIKSGTWDPNCNRLR